MKCHLDLPSGWVNASKLDDALRSAGDPLGPTSYETLIRLPDGCKLIIDAVVRLLSLANQLASSTRRVRLEFAAGEGGAMSYLNRIGFFDHLAAPVEVLPRRPSYSAAERYRGGNAGLVEIARINKDAYDQALPARLTAALMRSGVAPTSAKELEGAAWTIFAELIGNVYEHSETRLDSYAALQVYKGGDQVMVAVSDSGHGLMNTLRPALQTQSPQLAELTDAELLVEMFRHGLSRFGPDRGCGLRGSAAKAMKFNAELDVRLPKQRVLLTPARGAYRPNRARGADGLPLLWGTHIGFTFRLGA